MEEIKQKMIKVYQLFEIYQNAKDKRVVKCDW